MRVQAIAWKVILVCFFALGVVHAADSNEKEMRKLFDKYDQVMSQQKVELIEEVFTKKFLEAHGGKDAYAEKVKTLPYIKPKKGVAKFFQKLKKSKVGKFFTVKDNQDGEVSKSFIVKEEDGKLKIDGTVSDG